jgi:hypothetical protein
MMTKADRLLLVFLILAGVFLLAWRAGSFSGGLREVQVVQEGREVFCLALAGQEAEQIPLTLRGGQAFLEVADGAVRLCRQGDKPFCPRETCLATGWIKSPGQAIVCVPNRLVIRILETGEAAIDAVSR